MAQRHNNCTNRGTFTLRKNVPLSWHALARHFNDNKVTNSYRYYEEKIVLAILVKILVQMWKFSWIEMTCLKDFLQGSICYRVDGQLCKQLDISPAFTPVSFNSSPGYILYIYFLYIYKGKFLYIIMSSYQYIIYTHIIDGKASKYVYQYILYQNFPLC